MATRPGRALGGAARAGVPDTEAAHDGGGARGDLVLLTVVSIWSANFAINRYGVTHGIDPMVYAGLRYSIAGAFFAGVTLWKERSLRIRREDWLLFFGICLLSTFVNQIAFFNGIHLASAATVSLCFGTMPAFVGIIAALLGVARPTRRHWLATAVSFGGVALVAAGGEADLSGNLGGLLLALAAVMTYSLYTVSLTKLGNRYSPYRISAVTSLGMAGPLLAIGAHGAAQMDWGAIGGLAWGSLAYTTIPGYIISNVLWIAGLGLRGPNRAALYANLQVFGGAAAGVLLLGESLSGLQAAGGAVIAVGIVLSLRRIPLPRWPLPE